MKPQRDLMMDENGDMVATGKSDKQITYEKGQSNGMKRGYIIGFVVGTLFMKFVMTLLPKLL